MRIIGGLVGWMSPWAKILGGLEPLGPHEVGAYVCMTLYITIEPIHLLPEVSSAIVIL